MDIASRSSVYNGVCFDAERKRKKAVNSAYN